LQHGFAAIAKSRRFDRTHTQYPRALFTTKVAALLHQHLQQLSATVDRRGRLFQTESNLDGADFLVGEQDPRFSNSTTIRSLSK